MVREWWVCAVSYCTGKNTVFSCEHHLQVHGYLSSLWKKTFWYFKGATSSIQPHFMFLGFLQPCLLQWEPLALFSEGNCTGLFPGDFQSLKEYLNRKILPREMATQRSAFCMEFLGDMGFPLFLKTKQNAFLRDCELLISAPNFFAPMSWITCWQVIFSFGTCLFHVWNREIQIVQLDWLCSSVSFLKSIFPLVGI